MERVLAVVDDTDMHREMLAKAGRTAAGTDSELVVLSWTTPEGHEQDWDAINTVGNMEGKRFDTDPLDVVHNFLSELTAEVFETHEIEDVDAETAAVVCEDDDLAKEIVAAGNKYDCEHVFLVGQKRSPTGKAVFGDTAQQVILNYDGYVTIKTQ